MSRRRTSHGMVRNVILLPNARVEDVDSSVWGQFGSPKMAAELAKRNAPGFSGFGEFGSPEIAKEMQKQHELNVKAGAAFVQSMLDGNLSEMKRNLRRYRKARDSASAKNRATARKFLANAMISYGAIVGAVSVVQSVEVLYSIRNHALRVEREAEKAIRQAMAQENLILTQDEYDAP